MNPSNPLAPHVAAKLEPGDLLTDVQLSRKLHTALQTVRNWRTQGKGPRYVKLCGRLVRYRPEDVQAFIEAGERAP